MNKDQKPLVNDLILIFNKVIGKLESISRLDQCIVEEIILDSRLTFELQKDLFIHQAKKFDFSFPVSFLDEETNQITKWYDRAEHSIYGGDIYRGK